MDTHGNVEGRAAPWNNGNRSAEGPAESQKIDRAIRIRLQLDHRARELAFSNLALRQQAAWVRSGGSARARRSGNC